MKITIFWANLNFDHNKTTITTNAYKRKSTIFEVNNLNQFQNKLGKNYVVKIKRLHYFKLKHYNTKDNYVEVLLRGPLPNLT